MLYLADHAMTVEEKARQLTRMQTLNLKRGIKITQDLSERISDLLEQMRLGATLRDDPTASTKHITDMPITSRLAQGCRTEQQDACAYGVIANQSLQAESDIDNVIVALRESDRLLAQAVQRSIDGCTKTTCVVITLMNGQRYILTSNCGDSGAYFAYRGHNAQQFTAEPLAVIHDLEDPTEKTRIEAADGYVSQVDAQARLNGNLAMSRTFGDCTVGAGLTSTPEYTLYSVPEDCTDASCFVFSDGFSDAIAITCLPHAEIAATQMGASD